MFSKLIAVAACCLGVAACSDPAAGVDQPAAGGLPNGGTGVFIDVSGALLTAAHVVADCQKIEIGSDQVAWRTASVERSDDAHDVALLSSPGPVPVAVAVNLQDEQPPYVAFGYSGATASQTPEMAWPRPLNQDLRTGAPQEARDLLWFEDRSISHGWSGGPVIDAKGSLVGLIKSVATDPADMAGIMNLPDPASLAGVAAAEPARAFSALLPPDLQTRPGPAQSAVVRVLCWPPG